ncbi:branched-chain amino acid ABC transporter permease [Agrobacterium sp. S7/73]|uniref:branched-chain amino acid ABC transporter permease n=2 Tax=Rhizobiaceae TaxID=82115 RepID=UPI001C5BADBC|nr:branched-chain amino acid ABC transporter permease [Agrobacterium sp. S7/73]QXZ76079.1 branched-chain amino acid ABC transporter permease [Agrobacterium sp. S7/73]
MNEQSMTSNARNTGMSGRLVLGEAPTVCLFLIAVLLPLFVESYLVSGLTRILVYGLAAGAVGFLIYHGGLVSFGHAAFFGIGGYTVLVAQLSGLNEALIVWPLAALIAAAAGFVIGGMSLKTRGVAFIMITLGFSQMIFFVLSSLPPIGSSDGMGLTERNVLAGYSLAADLSFHFVVVTIVAVCVIFMKMLSRSPFGLALRSIRQNERRVISLGFDTYRIQLAAFIFSAALTGLAGALAANFYLFVSPVFLSWLLSGELLVMAALGGLGPIAGGLFGSALLIGVEAAVSEYTTYWRLFLGPMVILSVLFFKQGLEPSIRRLAGGRYD